jgi:hypothetical protein
MAVLTGSFILRTVQYQAGFLPKKKPAALFLAGRTSSIHDVLAHSGAARPQPSHALWVNRAEDNRFPGEPYPSSRISLPRLHDLRHGVGEAVMINWL